MDIEWNKYRPELIVVVAALFKKHWVPWDPGRQWVNQALAMHPCSKTSHVLCPGWVSTNRAGWRKSLHPPLFSTCEMTCVILGPAAGSPVQERSWLKQLRRPLSWSGGRRTCDIMESLEGTGFVQHQKEYWNLTSVYKYVLGSIEKTELYCKRMRVNRSWNMRHYDLIHTFTRKVV